MKLIYFINKYAGNKVDFDGAYGAQCVDLFRLYCLNVLGIDHTGVCSKTGYAQDLWNEYPNMPKEVEHFKRLKARAKIKFGDVCVWEYSDGTGHVAIALKSFPHRDRVLVFEQNGNDDCGCRLNIRSRDSLLGALRFRGRIEI